MPMDDADRPLRDGAPDDRSDLLDGAPGAPAGEDPVRRQGHIEPALLDPHALTVVRRLSHHGQEAYLVGGCVRDLLAGLEPKDFDVVTDAHPNRIKRLFRNARIIGRRFRLAHIRFGPDHIIETSTFRADPGAPNGNGTTPDENGERAPGGYVASDRANDAGTSENIFGTAPEDARRRDFTINALFYDPVEDEIIDWVGGLRDLEDGVIRSIGDPYRRLVEDPVRMIRAAHFEARMGFRLEERLEQAIRDQARELENASPARLYIELVKILNRGRARLTLERLHELGALEYWLPELAGELDALASSSRGGEHDAAEVSIGEETWSLLAAADRWGMAAHEVADAVALAPLLAPWIVERWRREGARRGYAAFADCYDATVRPMALRMSVPKRTIGRMRELIWVWLELQQPPHPRRAKRTVHRPAFPHALNFLRLDLEARDAPRDVLHAWEALAPAPRDREPHRARTSEPERQPRRPAKRSRNRRGRREREGERREPPPRIPREAEAWAPAPAPGDGPSRDASAPESAEGTRTPRRPARDSAPERSAPREPEHRPREHRPREHRPREQSPQKHSRQEHRPPEPSAPPPPAKESSPEDASPEPPDTFAEGLE